ncbi:MAG: PAS domain S-box protein [Deltaproteobacteria bacterium]|nr:PAS domain S-box protein [Deltaproteobacteria bacterium]
MNLRHAPDTALSPDPPKDYDALGRALAEAQDVRRLWGLTLGYLRARRGIVGGVYMLNRREDELQRLTTSDEREELRLLSNSFGLQTDVVWEVLSSGAPFQYNLPEPEPDDDLNVAAWSHGIRHCAIFPLRRGNVAWGLALFPQSRPFTEDQMAEFDLVIRLTCAHDLAIQASARHTLADGMLNALMSASDQGVIVASESGEILYYNDRLAALSGWSRADVDRVGWLNLAYPDPTYRAQVTATLRELLRSDGYRARWLITCRGGDERPVEVSTRAVSDPLTGKRVLMGTFRDLSEPRPVGIEPPQRCRAEPPRGDERVWVADELGELVDLAGIRLRGLGYEVRTFQRADELLSAAEDASAPKPHLLILDVGLPDRAPSSLAHQLRLRGVTAPILWTSSLTPETSGMTPEVNEGFLSKPYTGKELAQGARGLLDRWPALRR